MIGLGKVTRQCCWLLDQAKQDLVLGMSALFSVLHTAEIPFLPLPREWMNFLFLSEQNRHIPSVLSEERCSL